MQFSKEQISQFEEHITTMENLIKVYNWESCNLIRAYLTIFGKMQAPEISERIGLQGAKSVYKSLNRLIDAGLIVREYEQGSQRNAYYYPINKPVNDPDFTSEFITYLIDQKKYHLIADYLTAANQASMGFLQVMTDIMEKRISSSADAEIGTKYINQTMFVEAILSVTNPIEFKDKLQQFIQRELPDHLPQSSHTQTGIAHPAAFYMAYVPLSGTSDLPSNA